MFGRIKGKRPAGMSNEEFSAKLGALGIKSDEVTHYAMPRQQTKLPAGTMVEVVDPNYKTRVVGTLHQESWTGVYYEPVIIITGNARTAACGYIKTWKAAQS